MMTLEKIWNKVRKEIVNTKIGSDLLISLLSTEILYTILLLNNGIYDEMIISSLGGLVSICITTTMLLIASLTFTLDLFKDLPDDLVRLFQSNQDHLKRFQNVYMESMILILIFVVILLVLAATNSPYWLINFSAILIVTGIVIRVYRVVDVTRKMYSIYLEHQILGRDNV